MLSPLKYVNYCFSCMNKTKDNTRITELSVSVQQYGLQSSFHKLDEFTKVRHSYKPRLIQEFNNTYAKELMRKNKKSMSRRRSTK